MEKTPIQNGESILKPRARLIKTIGEDLISNDIVAVIELVKNSYDANSPIVIIEFKGDVEKVVEGKKEKRIIKRERSSLSIYDEGDGMTLNIIKNAWMEPATNFKKKPENENKKRRFTGEKGIGRFASAKLAKKLEIFTKIADDNEVVVSFNWEDFSDEQKYLDEVVTQWRVTEPNKIQILLKDDVYYTILTPSCDFIEDVQIRRPRSVGKVLLAKALPLSGHKYFELYKSNPNRDNVTNLIRLIETRKGDRYFFLPGTPFMENLILDFQDKIMKDYNELNEFTRVAKLDSPFAQSMITSFIRYYNRIGFPDIDADYVLRSL